MKLIVELSDEAAISLRRVLTRIVNGELSIDRQTEVTCTKILDKVWCGMAYCPKCNKNVQTIVSSGDCEVSGMVQYNERCICCHEIISSRREKRA